LTLAEEAPFTSTVASECLEVISTKFGSKLKVGIQVVYLTGEFGLGLPGKVNG